MIPLFIILGVLLALVLFYLLFLVRPRAKKPPIPALLCDYAHRGLHGNGIPENSLAAFSAACEKGVGIELDVQLSSDGEVMVFHDYTLTRMTGCERAVCELTKEELCRLSLAGTEQKIPTFSEVLSLIDGRVPVLVELKGENTDTSLCRRVADQLKDYKGAYCIESFNPLLVGKIQAFLPDAYCGLLYTNLLREKKKVTVLNLAITAMLLNFLARPHFISYNGHDRGALPVRLTTRLYRCARFVWTIRSAADMECAHRLGESPIFENID